MNSRSVLRLAFFIILTSLIFACKSPVKENDNLISCDRYFHTNQFYVGGQTYVPANKIKETEHLEIYIKVDQHMSEYDINYIATNFENHYDNLTNIYGPHTDMDNNDKIIIVLYDINENYSPGQSYTAGYFNPNDLLNNLISNKGEILYVECQVANYIENIFATAVHEFQHLINYNMTNNKTEVWLNEALSCSAEIYLFKALQSYRQDSYNKYSHVTIKKGNNFYYWKNDIAD